MYLKALEIQGFKSFPDKTVLSFGSDITAIVGPNGSGKSNIADAIRWVMGEQSTRTLRGSKMEDVIFDGTAKRKGLGFAEVTLVIDNTEHIFPMEDSVLNSDQKNFKCGVAVMACKKRPVVGYYCPSIHTARDTYADQGNIDFLSEGLSAFVSRIQPPPEAQDTAG